MKSRITNILLVLVFFAGLSLLLYPTLSNYWNSFHQSRAVNSYTEQVAQLDNSQNEEMIAAAQAYNAKIALDEYSLVMDDADYAEYNSLLDVTGTGIMGTVEIPQINVNLPIYHGTSNAVLQIATGHIPGTSLPVGGESTHCVVSGHRGLPSARLFTDVDQLIEGDIFLLRTLNIVLTYQIVSIRIVLPHEVDALQIQQGEDLCTLVTCTPYGINTHRLLVTGKRIETVKEGEVFHVTADASQIEPLLIAPILAVPPLVLIVLVVIVQNMVSDLSHTKKRGGSRE